MSTEKVGPEQVDVEELKEKTAKLVQSNTDKQNAILAQTGGVPDQGFIASVKLEVFIDTFLDPKAKAVYAYNLQMRLKTLLDEDMKQLRQVQIMQGVDTPSKRLLLPGN